jgi:tetratricopeptide (TPR) repeat protein
MTEIEKLVNQKKWAPARRSIQDELLVSPTDHWLWMTMSLTYYEQRQYEKALECAKRAVELQSDCPLALWHLAGSYYMCGREEAAVSLWTILLDMDVEKVAYGECGEGMDWALQLLNDVHYRIARYYQHKADWTSARKSFEKYLHNRRHGVGSIYDRKAAEEYLALAEHAGEETKTPVGSARKS